MPIPAIFVTIGAQTLMREPADRLAPRTGCGAAWLAHLSGGQGVGSSNLPSPTSTKHLLDVGALLVPVTSPRCRVRRQTHGPSRSAPGPPPAAPSLTARRSGDTPSLDRPSTRPLVAVQARQPPRRVSARLGRSRDGHRPRWGREPPPGPRPHHIWRHIATGSAQNRARPRIGQTNLKIAECSDTLVPNR